MPGALHVGATTDADTRYIDVGSAVLASGRRLWVPLKVWVGKRRQDNVPHVPQITYPGDLQDTKAVQAWVLQSALPLAKRIGKPGGGVHARPILPFAPRKQFLGQLFAQLYAPLVEAVDAPQRAADEDTVFVQRNQRAERRGAEPLHQKEGAGPVARAVPGAALAGAPHQQGLGLGDGVDDEVVLVAFEELAPTRAAMNSTGSTSRPWWIIWKNACWPLVPGSPQTTGEVA
ncbi:hypothetical protein FQR65_LT07998 [Abscondita terminalis]|nr:hypothetical protein FQR65_LT07998 [Abscondita terminalis]